MIQTSNFATCGKLVNAVSISGAAPEWYTGKQYRKLAPRWWFFKLYKETGDEDHYCKHFQLEVLDKLDPRVVFDELDGAVLLCYEKPGEFCHRRLVATWLETKLGIVVPEYTKESRSKNESHAHLSLPERYRKIPR